MSFLRWRMPSSETLCLVALVRTDVPGENVAPPSSGWQELRTMLEILFSVRRLLVKANVVPSSPILISLIMEGYFPPKRRFLQEPLGVTSQKTPFFIVTPVKTSNLTYFKVVCVYCVFGVLSSNSPEPLVRNMINWINGSVNIGVQVLQEERKGFE
jgi:hypothetical protein